MAVDYITSIITNLEDNYDERIFFKWMEQYWWLCFVCVACYLTLIFSIKLYMKDRPRFELRLPLAIWSTVLAIFSIIGMIRSLPEFIHSISHHGFDYSVCIPSYFTETPTSFWIFLFTTSKVYELGDTIFVVLRKQPLIFLHWYHHVSVLIYVWYSYTEHISGGRWYMAMNFTVHAAMYTYYALKAFRIPVPKFISMCITAMQLLQMLAGIWVNFTVYNVKSRGEFCQQTWGNLRYASLMYFSYFLLFSHFFYSTYLKPKSRFSPEKKDVRHGHSNGHLSNGVDKKVQ